VFSALAVVFRTFEVFKNANGNVGFLAKALSFDGFFP
jgi:hypothetical protein